MLSEREEAALERLRGMVGTRVDLANAPPEAVADIWCLVTIYPVRFAALQADNEASHRRVKELERQLADYQRIYGVDTAYLTQN